MPGLALKAEEESSTIARSTILNTHVGEAYTPNHTPTPTRTRTLTHVYKACTRDLQDLLQQHTCTHLHSHPRKATRVYQARKPVAVTFIQAPLQQNTDAHTHTHTHAHPHTCSQGTHTHTSCGCDLQALLQGTAAHAGGSNARPPHRHGHAGRGGWLRGLEAMVVGARYLCTGLGLGHGGLAAPVCVCDVECRSSALALNDLHAAYAPP
jgi:hypothetical protein